MHQPNIVCITPYVPYDGIDHAGGEYLHRYLRAIRDLGAIVTVVAPNTPANVRAQTARDDDIDVLLLEGELRTSAIARALRLVATGSSQEWPRDWLRRMSPAAFEAIQQADLIDLQWTESVSKAAILRRSFPDKPIVATLHDVMTESLGRARRSPSMRIRTRAYLAYPGARRTERRNLTACDDLYVFKEADRHTLRRIRVTTRSSTTMPIVDESDGFPSPSLKHQRLLFTGAMFRTENSEAVDWFLAEVWPLVLHEYPRATFRVAGSRPPKHLVDLDDPTVEVTGYLERIGDAYLDVAAIVSPLRRGAGLKFKVAQAIASGYPIICTTVAVEGINDLLGEMPRHVSDLPNDFARAVCEVLHNLEQEHQLARDLAERVRPNLDFEKKMAELMTQYRRLIASSSLGDTL